MPPVHVHLHVRDLEESAAFYRRWFGLVDGLDLGDIRFVTGRNLELALAADPAAAPLPGWFHWGFKLDSASEVAELHDRLAAAGVEIVKALERSDDIALFRLADPDGHRVEVYWD